LKIIFFNRLKSQPYYLQSLALFACLGIFYLLLKVISFQNENGFVFRMIWLAGKIWASGQDPYGPLFLQEYEASGSGPEGLWYYPPNWYPIAVPFSYLRLSVANSLWRAITFLLLMAATHLIARALADISKQPYAVIFTGGLGFVCFMQAAAVIMYNGQTSIIVFFGFAALIFGLLKRRVRWVIAGLVFLALKPQIGIVAFAGVAALPSYRRAILFAGGVCILATTPVLLTGSYRAAIEGFLANLARYSSQSANDPNNFIGLTHIYVYVFSKPINSINLIIAAAIIAFAIFYFSSLNGAEKAESTKSEIAVLAFFIAAMFFLLPLHSYDIVVLTILLMVTLAIPLDGRWLVAIGLAICIRPGNLSGALGLTNPASSQFPESLIISIALCFVLSGALWGVFDLQRRKALPQE